MLEALKNDENKTMDKVKKQSPVFLLIPAILLRRNQEAKCFRDNAAPLSDIQIKRAFTNG